MNPRSRTAHGHPFTAAAVVGSFTLALVVLLRVAGVFDAADAGFRQWFVGQGFAISPGSVQPWWDFPLVMLVIYSLVWLVFETPGMTRRLLVILTAEVLLLSASLVAALWGVFWTPVGLMLGVAWAGSCALVWARQHPMPCEVPESTADQPDQGKIVPMQREDKEVERPDSKGAARRNGSKDKN